MSVQNTALDFVTYILQQVCEEKEKVAAEIKEDDRGTVIVITIDPSDMGRVIGKNGRNISALRTLVTTIAARDGMRIAVKVLETEDEESESE